MGQISAGDQIDSEPHAVPVGRNELFFLLGVTLLGLFLRMLMLGRASLWTDEILFVRLAALDGALGDVYRAHLKSFLVVSHLPLPAMVVHGFMSCLKPFLSQPPDQYAFLLRLPSALWGGLSVPFLALTMKQLVPRKVAWGGTLFYATFFFPVFFSREAYVYAPLMFWCNLGCYLVVKILSQNRLRVTSGVGLFLCMTALLHTHLTGAVWVLACMLVCFGWALFGPAGSKAWSVAQKNRLKVSVIGLASIVTALPFYGQYLGKEQSLVFPASQGFWANITDALSKMCLGVHPVAIAVMWLFMILAHVYLFRVRRTSSLLVFVWIWMVLSGVIVSWVVFQKQYFSRYFIVVLPGIYLMLSCGAYQFSELFGRIIKGPKLGRTIYVGVVLLLSLFHVVLFLPLCYRLPAKSVNFKGIAEWLNDHVPPGRPYLMESGYELRFVSGYFPTPGLVAACPYVHGHGAEEMKKLRAHQSSFLLRFPEAPFIESARHGISGKEEYEPWTWPHRYFAHKAVLWNKPLERLKQFGIWPQSFGKESLPQENEIFIWYNQPEDLRKLAVRRGDSVFYSFKGWACQEVQRGTYARSIPQSLGKVGLENLEGKELTGKFTLTAALSAPEQSFQVEFMLDDRPLGTASKWGGTFWSYETPELTLSPGVHLFEWGVKTGSVEQLQGLLLHSLTFERSLSTLSPKENNETISWTPPPDP